MTLTSLIQHFLAGTEEGTAFHEHMTPCYLNKNSVLLARKKAGGGGNGCGIGNQQCFSHHPHLFERRRELVVIAKLRIRVCHDG